MDFKDIRNFHERINLLFHFSLALPLVPIGFIFLESNHNNWVPPMPGNLPVLILSMALALIIFISAYLSYRRNLPVVREMPVQKDRFNALFREYRKLYLANLAASTALAVGYYLTTSPYLVGAYLVLLFSLSLLRPYYERYSRDLMLDDETAKAVRRMDLVFQEEADSE